MRQDWLVAAVLGVSMLAMAQQQTPKVINAQFHIEPAGAGLSATVNRFQHSNGPLWLGYEVAAVPGSHFSMCSGDSKSSVDNGCCGVYQLEGSNNNFRSSDGDRGTETSIVVLAEDRSGSHRQGSFHWSDMHAGCRRITVHNADECERR